MKRLLAAIVTLAFASCLAFAGLKVTEKSQGWRVMPARTGDVQLKDIAACREAVKLRGAGEYTCEYSTALKVEGTCDDVPKPALKLEVNAEGFVVQPGLVVKNLPDGSWSPTMREDFVAAPFPACWVPGLVPFTGEFPAADGPPTIEPGPWVYCVDYGRPDRLPLGKACPPAALGGCYIPPNAPDVCPVTP